MSSNIFPIIYYNLDIIAFYLKRHFVLVLSGLWFFEKRASSKINGYCNVVRNSLEQSFLYRNLFRWFTSHIRLTILVQQTALPTQTGELFRMDCNSHATVEGPIFLIIDRLWIRYRLWIRFFLNLVASNQMIKIIFCCYQIHKILAEAT